MRTKDITIGGEYAVFSGTAYYTSCALRVRVLNTGISMPGRWHRSPHTKSGVVVALVDKKTGKVRMVGDTVVTRTVTSREVRESWLAFVARMDEAQRRRAVARERQDAADAAHEAVVVRINAVVQPDERIGTGGYRLSMTGPTLLRLLTLAEKAKKNARE